MSVLSRRKARAILARGSRSFSLAAKLLPPSVRHEAAVIYAYCRRADDLVDEAPAGQAEPRAEALRRELDSLYAGEAQSDPQLAAFQQVVSSRGLPRQYPEDLLAGLASDARPVPIVLASWEELDLYCYRVAGTVGLMMAHLLGVSDPLTLSRAATLGRAMQLTNICRDVAEDWQRGRLYVPLEVIASHDPHLDPRSLRPGGALGPEARGVLSGCLPRLLSVAEALYREADHGIAALPARTAMGVRAARLIYSAIGERLAERGHDVGAGRAVVSAPRKLWLALRAAARPRPAVAA